MSQERKKPFDTRTLTVLAIFSALSSVLMMLDFPLAFFFPPFLKLDFSDLPALLAAFTFGPLSGVAVALIKNLVHLLISESGGVGELANFLVSTALAGTAGLVYRLRRTKAGALTGMLLGTFAMMAAGLLANYYLLIPFYEKIMPLDAIIDMCAKLIPAIQTKWDVVLLGITPFNLFKGLLISGLTFILYKRVRGLLK